MVKSGYIYQVGKPIVVVGSDLDLLDDMSQSGEHVAGYFSTRDKEIGFKYLGDHTRLNDYILNSRIVVAIDDPKFRRTIADQYGDCVSGYISPSAYISTLTKIPQNLLVYPKVYISANVVLGQFVKISVGAQIHHETMIGNFSVIAPQALILGHAQIESESFVGSGSRISPNSRIGSSVTIGMGSNVIGDLSDGIKAWGNPAREVRT
jgi:acyl-[acyl carrier protein]--UDP-N-acetylglucosamine O-acyltransferase